MELQTRLRLSFYREIADINTAHHIRLVQHTVSGKIFVKKRAIHIRFTGFSISDD